MQKKLNNIVRTFLGVAVVGLSCLSAFGQTTASAAVRAEVFKPLQAAQDALKNNQPQQAMALAKEALATPQLAVHEQILVQRTLAVAALNAKDYSQAMSALEWLVQRPELTVVEKRPLLESLINASQQKKDYPGVVKWARQYLNDQGDNPTVRPVLIQVLAVMNAHAEVIQEVQTKIKLDAAAGQKTPETELRWMAASQRQLKDNAGYEATLLKLLETYPTQAYWAEVIARQAQKTDGNPRLELDLYRLLEETDNLEEGGEYVEMIELALKAGLPQEAQRVMDKGIQRGLLGKGADASEHAKLRQQISTKVAEDEKSFASLERSAKDGNTMVGVADVWLSRQQWAQANAAYSKALGLGGVRRENEVYLHYAVSLLKGGQVEQSRKMLALVKDDKTAVMLAHLWGLRTQIK